MIAKITTNDVCHRVADTVHAITHRRRTANTDTQHNTNLKWRANCGDQTISTIDNQQATPHTTIATIV